MHQPAVSHAIQSSTLSDVLERVLDKGIVIAGDIKVKLVDIELLSLQIRLVICSVDKAREMGMDWWVNNPVFSSHAEPDKLGEAVSRIANNGWFAWRPCSSRLPGSDREAALHATFQGVSKSPNSARTWPVLRTGPGFPAGGSAKPDSKRGGVVACATPAGLRARLGATSIRSRDRGGLIK